MLGLVNDCAEGLVTSKFGLEAWHAIKAAASCDIKDGQFVKHESYPDSATIAIVVAAAEALNTTVDDVLEMFGRYFLQYAREKGYDNLLQCQGSSLRLWLSSLNALHDHLQSSLPAGNFPVFWCEDCEEVSGSILLHYYSVRGSLLMQLVVGIVKAVSEHYFDVEVEMERVGVQGEDDAQCTTWRVYALDPEMEHKVTGVSGQGANDALGVVKRVMARRASAVSSANGDEAATTPRCPFSGSMSGASSRSLMRSGSEVSLRSLLSTNTTSDLSLCHLQQQKRSSTTKPSSPISGGENGETKDERIVKLAKSYGLGLSSSKVQKIFPYHVMIDNKFTILQVGSCLPDLLGYNNSYNNNKRNNKKAEEELVGKSIKSVLKIIKPPLADWDWETMQKLSDQIFFLAPAQKNNVTRRVSLVSFLSSLKLNPEDVSSSDDDDDDDGNEEVERDGDPSENDSSNNKEESKETKAYNNSNNNTTTQRNDVRSTTNNATFESARFKGSVVQVSRHRAMLVLSPDVANISELSAMGLTMSDLPLHSFQRDSVFLGEHIASEVRSAYKLDKLSKRLERERDLSDTLLRNMLPESVAEDLRAGKTVEPTHFDNVTLFFSDVVGFTSICDAVEPWDVIDMLNQLYSVMDFLSAKFGLYKVETVGDAYMCCSGMPQPDERHAENVADYALAVRECVKLVLSPADGTPLKLRIGIHTGNCMGGVVGTLTPHFCLFGDMVNTTARHESTGLAEKIQASSVLYGRLKHFSADENAQYNFTPRGLVSMKGKGECYTYWLESGTEDNKRASPKAIASLFEEVGNMLAEKKWKRRKYFRRYVAIRDGESVVSSGGCFLSEVSEGVSVTSATSQNSLFEDEEMSGDGNNEDGTANNVGSSIRSDLDSAKVDTEEKYMEDLDRSANNQGEESMSQTKDVCNLPYRKNAWSEVGWRADLNDSELVAHVHDLFSDHFHRCLDEMPHNMDLLVGQLYGYIRAIAALYKENNCYHHWRHACHVVLGSSYLVDVTSLGSDDPWVGFAAIFAALVHDVKHLGVPNAQLERENHMIVQVFDGGSCQERQSCHASIEIFLEKFPDLSAQILRSCPNFLHLVTSAVLATDVASGDAQGKVKERFERVIVAETDTLLAAVKQERTQSILEHVLLMCDVGHCSQRFETFLDWNKMFFEECLANFISGRGDDPRLNWYQGQIGFIQGYILPLAERCERLLVEPESGESCDFVEGTKKVLQEWKIKGQEWTNKIIAESQNFIDFQEKHGLSDEAAEARCNDELNQQEEQKNLTGVCPVHTIKKEESAPGIEESLLQNGNGSYYDNTPQTNGSTADTEGEIICKVGIRDQKAHQIPNGVCPMHASKEQEGAPEVKKRSKKLRRLKKRFLLHMIRRRRVSLSNSRRYLEN